MNAYASAMTFSPMTKVAPVTGQFGPTMTAAQARAAAEAKIHATAKEFEAQFIGTMLSQSYEHVDLGGGQGADAFKSVMMQAIGKKIVSGRGIGLSSQVEAEMLKMQGLR